MRRLLLFAKRPRLGKVKSRLTPPYTVEEALQLYRALLRDLSAMLASLPNSIQVEWWWSDDDAVADDATFVPPGAKSCVQQGADLGQRLSHAFALSDGPTAVVGGDCPLVDAELIETAFRSVEQRPQQNGRRNAAVSPADDGGYLLLACGDDQPELFQEIPWGGSEVMARTAAAAADAGIDLERLSGGFDIDDAASLTRLAKLSASGTIAERIPVTLKWLNSQLR